MINMATATTPAPAATPAKPKVVRFTQEDEAQPIIVIDVKRSTLDTAATFIANSLKKAAGKDFGGALVEGKLKIFAAEE